MYVSAADYLVYVGFLGMAVIFFLLLYFLGRRTAWLFGIIFGMSVGSPNYKSGLIKFFVLLLLLIGFSAFTYVEFYTRAYPQFEKDKPSAEVFLYESTGNYSSISIAIQRTETTKTLQGGALENGPYLLLGETLIPPDWMRSLGVGEGFRFYGLLKGHFTANYIDMPVDINVSEKPNDFVWKILVAVQEILPFAEIEKHYIPLNADGYNSKFNIYASASGFKRD